MYFKSTREKKRQWDQLTGKSSYELHLKVTKLPYRINEDRFVETGKFHLLLQKKIQIKNRIWID